MKPNELGAFEAAQKIRDGELTSEALVTACLDRIKARDADVRAWQALDEDLALAQARKLDQELAAGSIRGAMHGVPVGFKDIIETRDLPTTYGSPIYERCQPAVDAACVTLTKAAGAVLLGKTVTTEFAFVNPSITRNPSNLAHTPGGSSSGSAAAVSDCMVPIAFGTQTGGSIIRPSSFNGVVGYKPTFASYSYAGVKVLAGSLCTLGTIARRVDDHRLVRDAMLGTSMHARTKLERPVIGLCETPWWGDADADTRAALHASAKALEAGGADVRALTLPDGFAELPELNRIIMTFEGLRCLSSEIGDHDDLLSERLKEALYPSRDLDFEQYAAARNARDLYRMELDVLMQDFDAMLVPSATGEAPEGFATTGNSIFNAPWTTLGAPCITVPAALGAHGLPVGVQLVGGIGDDDHLLNVAGFVEGCVPGIRP